MIQKPCSESNEEYMLMELLFPIVERFGSLHTINLDPNCVLL